MKGGKEKEIKDCHKTVKLKEIRNYILLKCWYPAIYRFGKKRVFDKKRIIIIENFGKKLSVNFQPLFEKLKKRPYLKVKIIYLEKERGTKIGYLWRCTKLVWDSASAGYIFLADALNVFSCVSIRSDSVYTQLWHGCGAFKKFGNALSKGKKETYSNYNYNTWMIVSSPEVRWAYKEACGLPEEAIIATGISRTDRFFDREFHKRAKEKIRKYILFNTNRKIILYAPTFRGDALDAQMPRILSLIRLKAALEKQYVIVFKQHPHIKEHIKIPKECADFVFDVSEKMEIDELMCVADLCITDYSSLIFEYSIFERPILFYAYDLKEYCKEQGFFYEFESFVPGYICKTEEDIIYQIEHITDYDLKKMREFRKKFMSSCDGHATERILKLVFGESW